MVGKVSLVGHSFLWKDGVLGGILEDTLFEAEDERFIEDTTNLKATDEICQRTHHIAIRRLKSSEQSPAKYLFII